MAEDYLKPSDDVPKLNPWQDDRLGYAPFAERLFKVVANMQAPEGYVIGVHGEWGSGKTTALNFVKEYLQKHNVEAESDEVKVEVIDFAPWIVSGHQDLIAAFFKILAEKLGKQPGKPTKWARTAKGSAEGLVTAVGKVGVLVDPTFGVVTGTAKIIGVTFDKLLERFLEEPSLQKAYQELKDELKDKGRKCLVIIDDIDRLQRDEIRYVMQMVKTVGRLPNVIYMLAYDRDIVWSALDEPAVPRRAGPNFAEKIIQHEVELPKPLIDDLLVILDQECAFLTGPTSDNKRWHYIVRDGVRRWIRQPRDVFRFANAIKFSWPALQGEIDPQDLFAMEGLRLFDEETFNWLRWNRDFLFAEGSFFMAQEDVKTAAVKQLLDAVDESSRASWSRLLSVLFPQRSKEFAGQTGFTEPYFEIVRRRGIGVVEGYDAYFSLFPSPNAVPKAVIDALMQKLGEEAAISSLIAQYLEKKDRRNIPMIGKLLQEIAFRFEGAPLAQPTPELLSALVKSGDTIMAMERDYGFFETSPRDAYRYVVKSLLKAWGPEEAGRQLEAVIEQTSGVFIPAFLVVERARELGDLPRGGRQDPVINTEAARNLAGKLLPKIEAAARDGTLAEVPFFSHIVHCWSYAGGARRAKEWISKNAADNPQVLAKVALSQLSYTLGDERSYSMDSAPDQELYDYSAMHQACVSALEHAELNAEQRKQIETFSAGLAKLIAEGTNKMGKDEAPDKNGEPVIAQGATE